MRLAQRVQHDLRNQTYSKLQKKKLSFFESARTGNLLSILNDDINQLERFLNNSFNEILQIITLFIFAGYALFAPSLLCPVSGALRCGGGAGLFVCAGLGGGKQRCHHCLTLTLTMGP